MRANFNRYKLGNVRVFFTRLGYHPGNDASYERRLNRGERFPRFHVYIEEHGDEVSLNLHLDAKAPSYEGASAHAGEYSGPLVETEISRITSSVPQ